MSFWTRAKDILTWKRESEINNLKLNLHSFFICYWLYQVALLMFKKILVAFSVFLVLKAHFLVVKALSDIQFFPHCWNEYAGYYIILSYRHRIFWQQNLPASSAIAQGWKKDYTKPACLHLSFQQSKKKHGSIFNRALPLKCFLCLFFVLIKWTPFSYDCWSCFLITLLSDDIKKYWLCRCRRGTQ